MTDINRRQFLQRGGAALASLALAQSIVPVTTMGASKRAAASGFTMWQLDTQCNQIGNTYVFRTDAGRIIVMDGGWQADENYLRGFLQALGGEVDTWFISHPHSDHRGTLTEILKASRGIRVRRIIHSPLSDAVIDGEPPEASGCREFYALLDKLTETEVIALNKPGFEGAVDGFNFRILGVANPEYTMNPFNNSSMIIRVWDARKSLVFLGDAGVECADKVLNGPYGADLDCDYMQMGHHGQAGPSESFYRKVNFRACLWSTPCWVWNNDTGRGFNTGHLQTLKTRAWMDAKGIKEHHVSWMGLWRLD